MKKFLILIFIFLIFLNSCYFSIDKNFRITTEIPYIPLNTKWESKNPEIIIDFINKNSYYIKIDEKINIYFYYDAKRGEVFNIYNEVIDENNKKIPGDIIYFSGNYSLEEKNKKLYLYLNKEYQEKTGYTEIVFDLVKEYSEQ